MELALCYLNMSLEKFTERLQLSFAFGSVRKERRMEWSLSLRVPED